MKKLNKIICAVLAFAMIFTLAACGKSSTTTEEKSGESKASVSVDSIKKAGKLVIATNAEFEPFEYKDGTNITGFDIDMAKNIATDLGVTLEVSDMAFDNILVALQTNLSDLGIAGMTVKPDRLKSVDFSDTYFVASQVIIEKDGNALTTTSELKGKAIGVQKGTTGADFVRENIGEPQEFANGALAIEALKSGNVDYVVIDNYPAQKFVKNNTGLKIFETPLTKEEYAIAIPKGADDIKTAVNKSIADMKENGEFEALLTKYGLN